MPRRHIRKPDSRKYGYEVAAMQVAISDVNEKGLSVKKAAFLHQLNRTTLRRHLNDLAGLDYMPEASRMQLLQSRIFLLENPLH